ncbi:MAG: hypothetical protein ACRENC_14065, partial [Gemmatimonadaceae bacterium]
LPRFGIQLGAATSSTFVGGGSTPEGLAPPVGARVSFGTAEVLYALTRNDSRARIWLEGGGSVVQHSGSAYDRYDNPVNVGGVLGAGSAIHLVGPLSAELGVTTLIYRMHMRGSGDSAGVMERGTQVDALFRTGVSCTWH